MPKVSTRETNETDVKGAQTQGDRTRVQSHT